MTREESLKFLRKCLYEIENASEEEIEKLRELYKKHYNTSDDVIKENEISNGE